MLSERPSMVRLRSTYVVADDCSVHNEREQSLLVLRIVLLEQRGGVLVTDRWVLRKCRGCESQAGGDA